MPNALRFRNWKTPKQVGERVRLKVVHGPDSGSLFVVTAPKFTIGRGEENDVVIGDLRASRRHAELVRQPNGMWHLTDLGSQNGVVWNGKIRNVMIIELKLYFMLF
jgi:pSer/pThr/pTyr-binding forkhead associated (FHA) protein